MDLDTNEFGVYLNHGYDVGGLLCVKFTLLEIDEVGEL